MLSILIPIHNYDAIPLVSALSGQAKKLGVAYEILVYDDASDPKWKAANESLASRVDVSYAILDVNLGRAKIRNKLAADAAHDYLLFLDCDSGIIRDDFLKAYLDLLPSEAIIAGGREYAKEPPSSKAKTLHWLYGHKKESRSLAERKAAPAKYFHSNNFMVSKAIFSLTTFNESIQGYGYEDLALAAAFEQKGISLMHIANPVEHLSLEDAAAFLAKTKQAIDNLILLKESGVDITTNLESFAGKVDLVKLRPIVQGYYNWNEKKILSNLNSESPSLANLDLFKLNYYFTQTEAHKKSL